MVLSRWHSMATDPSSLGVSTGTLWVLELGGALFLGRAAVPVPAGPLSFLAGRPWLARRHGDNAGHFHSFSTFHRLYCFSSMMAQPHRAGLSLVAVEVQVALADLIEGCRNCNMPNRAPPSLSK